MTMGRPPSVGLDYFPLDCDIENDSAVCLLEAKHGPIAFAVLIKLYCRCYRAKGYYTPWNEREELVFSRQTGISLETIRSILEDCLDEGLFDRNMYVEQGILTSNGIQKRFSTVTKRRTDGSIRSEYSCKEGVSVTETTPKPAVSAESTHKGKERKGKERSTLCPTSDDADASPVDKPVEPKTKDGIPLEVKFPEEARLAELMGEKIREVNPKSKYVASKQIDAIEKLHRIDKRDYFEIEAVIRWLWSGMDRDSEFWQKNILSGATLREKFDRLWGLCPSVKKGAPRKEQPIQPSEECPRCHGMKWIMLDDSDTAKPCPECGGSGRKKGVTK